MAKKTGKTVKRKTPSPKKTNKTSAAKTTPTRGNALRTGPRKLKPAKPKPWHLKKGRHPVKLPNVWKLSKTTTILLWQHKKLFIGLTVVYGLLNLILVQGLSNSADVSTLKNEFSSFTHGSLGSLVSGLSIFAVLVGSAGNGSSQTAGAYQLFLALITSLAIIWSLRQVMAGHQIRIRDAYYRGMYPLIPFILVLLVIGLQLIPLLIGSSLYNLVSANGIAVGGLEKFIWLVVFIVLALISLYMLSVSLFALYVVTLPEMTPLKALRSAKQLVKYRRWTVIRKVLFLPVILLIAAAIIMLPIILWLTFLSQWVFFLLTMFGLVAVHAYMYTLYRELLNE